MKSKLFSRGYDPHFVFDHRQYTRYLNSEINDQVLSPVSDKYDSEIFHLIDASENQEKIISKVPKQTNMTAPHEIVKYIVAPQKQKYIMPDEKFKELWTSFHPKVIKRLSGLLGFKNIMALMKTCKDCYSTFENSIWEDHLESRLRVAIEKKGIPNDLKFLKTLYKNHQFSLNKSASGLFDGSHSLFKTQKLGPVNLARDLIDFQPVKSLELLRQLRVIAPENLTITLFLSHDIEQNQIILWTVVEKQNKFSPFRIRKFDFSQQHQVISCKFINEECFIIQVKGPEQDEHQILIFDVYAEFLRLENLAAEQSTTSNHTISLKYRSEADTLVQNENFVEINGKAPSEFSFCLDPHGRIIFYAQEQSLLTILLYDTRSGKLQTAYAIPNNQTQLLSLIVPIKNITSEERFEIFLVFDNAKIDILKYSMTDNIFSSQELTYLEEIEPISASQQAEVFSLEHEEITKFHKYRYGSFKNQEGKDVEYLITLHNHKFYYIDLHSKSAKKLLKIVPKSQTPSQSENVQTEQFRSIIEATNLMDWNTHENILVMTINYSTLVTVTFDSNANITGLVEDPNLLLPYARVPKAPRTEWPTFGNIWQTRMPPILVFNNSYLIILNFPYIEQNFQIYLIHFSSYLIMKGLVNFTFTNDWGRLDKFLWNIQSPDIFEKESSAFLKKINNSPNLPDLVKFQDNKLLIKLKTNIYFDLQSRANFQRTVEIPARQSQRHEIKWDLSVSQDLVPQTSTKEKQSNKKQNSKAYRKLFEQNHNHEAKNQLGTKEYDETTSWSRSTVNDRVMNKYRRKKSLEEIKKESESDDEEDDFSQKSKSKKDQEKKMTKHLLSRKGRDDLYDAMRSEGLGWYSNQKQYFLKHLNKKKDNQKKFRRREDSV